AVPWRSQAFRRPLWRSAQCGSTTWRFASAWSVRRRGPSNWSCGWRSLRRLSQRARSRAEPRPRCQVPGQDAEPAPPQAAGEGGAARQRARASSGGGPRGGCRSERNLGPHGKGRQERSSRQTRRGTIFRSVNSESGSEWDPTSSVQFPEAPRRRRTLPLLAPAESFELDEWGSLDEIARLESENRELLQRVQTLECGSSSSSDSSPESSEGSARPRLGSKQTVRFRRQATTDPAQRLNILYWKTLVERYVHSKSCSFQRLVISRWETFAERLVYWSQADSATEALKKDFQEQRKLNEDPLRVARQEAEEQAHIAQRLEEDMEARCSLEMSEAREKLVVTEQNYELVRQRVQELEEDQFEHSQSFMRQRQTALCDSGFGEMPQLIIPESAPVTAASLNHDLASTIAVHIRKNLTLQRRMAGLLEWRSTTTVSKLQYDIAREERNRESPDTRVAWLRAELEEERLKGEQEQEEHRGHRFEIGYEDQIAQLQERAGASLAERFSKHEKDEASASEARSRSRQVLSASPSRRDEQKGLLFREAPQSTKTRFPGLLSFRVGVSPKNLLEHIARVGASASDQLGTEGGLASQLAAAQDALKRAEEENRELLPGSIWKLHKAMQASADETELMAENLSAREVLQSELRPGPRGLGKMVLAMGPCFKIPGATAPKKKRPPPRDKRMELQKCPQKAGIVTRVYTVSPKKPNSAIRKVCRLKLSTQEECIAYIPGEGHNLQEFANVLIRGGRRRDLVGIKYNLIRGARDLAGVVGRRQSRSKYGAEKPDDDAPAPTPTKKSKR
ncbi:unnamed protein product, partial [Effrenium voratum]